MKHSFSKSILAIVLIVTVSLMLTSVSITNDDQIQDTCPLAEQNRSFVLSSPDYYLTVESDHGTPGGEGWYTDFTIAYASLDTGIVSGGTGVQYVFTNWGGDATGTNYAQSDPITMDANKTAIAVWKTQYYLTVETDHGTPSGDGWKDAGITANGHLDTGTESGGTGVQYVFTNWSGDSTGVNYAVSDNILMDGPKTATAAWKTQYYFDVQSDNGTPSGDGWKDAGSVVYADLDVGIVSGGTGIQYVFTNWGGDATGTDYASSDSIIMNSPKTATANWKTQYYLTVTSDHAIASGEGWKDAGISVYASLDAGIVAGGTDIQYIFTNWGGDATGTDYAASDSILMDGPKTVTANWKTQYFLTVTSDHSTPYGEDWHDAGSTVYASLDTDIVSGGTGVQYVFTNWGGDATGTNYAASDSILMDAPKTATAIWKTQYYLTVTTDHGTPSGAGWKDVGIDANAHLDTGVDSGGTGVQYVFTNWSGDSTGSDYAASDNILMDGPKTATAVWKTQYYLDVQSDHGVSSGSGWYDAGLAPNVGLDTGVVSGGTGTQYVFTNWGGDATGTNYAASDSIIMNSPKTATAIWKTQYYLTVVSDHASTSGDGWKDQGTSAIASVDAGIVAGDTGIQYVFTNWGGDATGTDHSGSDSIPMDAPKTATANWQTQYWLTITSDHGTPSGDRWQIAGSTAHAGLDTGIVPGTTGTQYAFTSWGGDASGSNYASSDSILMDAPKTAVANWRTQYYLNTSTDYGTISGDGWLDSGTLAHLSMDTDIIVSTSGTRYVFSSWGGDAKGTNYSRSDDILMDGQKVATASWQTQYRLNCTTDPEDLLPVPIKTPSGDWFDMDTNVTLEAQDVVGYTFQYWTIHGLRIAIIERSFNITMDASHSVVAHYQEVIVSPTSTTTPTTPTSPPPDGGIMVLALVGGIGIAAFIVLMILVMKKRSS